MRTRRRIITLAILGAVGVAFAAYALRPDVIAVDTARVVRGSMRVTVDAEGKTRVRDRYIVAAPVTGRIRRIELDEGDEVRAGQVVAWIAPLPLDALTREQASARLEASQALQREAATRVEQARVAEAHAAQMARRRAAVYEIGGISEEDRDAANVAHRARRDELTAAEARARAAAADVDAARAALMAVGGGSQSAVPVRAPCSGSVLRIPERSERVLAAGTPILELGDPSALEIIVDVLSTDAVRLDAGDAAEIVEWGGDKVLRAEVAAIEPSAFTQVSALGVDEQRVNVRLTVLEPPANLGDGFRVEARMTVWEDQNVLTVPASAAFQHGGVWSVFIVEDGRARRRAIEIGHRSSATVEILRGLEPGEVVIVFPSDEIDSGIRVKPRNPEEAGMTTQTTRYGIGTTVDLPYAAAVERTREALAKEGFGVLTEIDVRATLKKKLDVDTRPYVILGACNPALAHKALAAERDIGLLLPCNVIVYEADQPGKSVVAAMDPVEALSLTGNDEVRPIAEEVKARLTRALEAIEGA